MKTQQKKLGQVKAAVAVLGDKWTPQLIRALSTGSLRFNQLQHEADGVCPRTLSMRLTYLEAAGIVQKTTFPETPPHTEYALTPKGQDLLPILESMAHWSAQYDDMKLCELAKEDVQEECA
jgi:DNA-binding HxlR family transcriptional regulator